MVSEKHSLVARTSFTMAPPDEFGCAANAVPRCGQERFVPTRQVAVAAPILIRTEDFIARPCHSPKHVAISPAGFPRHPRRQPHLVVGEPPTTPSPGRWFACERSPSTPIYSLYYSPC